MRRASKRKDQEFDGEDYIKQQIGEWQKQDVVLLDPFAMWRQPGDQLKRSRYGAIVDGVLRHGPNAPSLIVFWTWGRDFPGASGDLNGTLKSVENGYQKLRARFHDAGFRFVRVKWTWQYQFAMWVVVPKDSLAALRDYIDLHCCRLSAHLLRRRCGLSHPWVEVAIDEATDAPHEEPEKRKDINP